MSYDILPRNSFNPHRMPDVLTFLEFPTGKELKSLVTSHGGFAFIPCSLDGKFKVEKTPLEN